MVDRGRCLARPARTRSDRRVRRSGAGEQVGRDVAGDRADGDSKRVCDAARVIFAAMRSYAFYIAAAFAEIAGSFAFWAWLRLGKSVFWLIPGVALLALFAFLLTRVDAAFAGRAYAAYGGVYIASIINLALDV